jgi:tetratricopeptide (TPR) repeat protein
MTEFKDKANEFFKAQNFTQALEFYNKAVEAEPYNHVHYSNRSVCYFKLANYQAALTDAEKCISIKEDWGKGYLRKGSALGKLNKHWNSFVAYSLGALYEPDNQTIKDE